MGIRQSLERITKDQLAELHHHPTRETADNVLSTNDQEDAFFFAPLDAPTSFEPIRRLCLEKSYWELLESIVKMPLPDDPLPAWPLVEGSPTIGDFWMGYSPLYLLDLPAVQSFAHVLESISEASLVRRFRIDFSQYKDMDAEEKEGVFAGMMECFEEVAQLVQQAAANDEAIVWYIS
jgi:hypothetical protein